MSLGDLPPTISVPRAGEILGISRRSAYRAARRGELPTFKVGSRILVPTARLLELLGRPETEPPVPPGMPSATDPRRGSTSGPVTEVLQ